MNNKQEEIKLIDKFALLPFDEKKDELLIILRRLYWVSDEVDRLWKLVYSIEENDTDSVFIKVYKLLLDAIYYAKNKKEERAMDLLKESSKVLSWIKNEESEEENKEKKDLDNLFKDF